jgi:hypothetical protein
MISIKRDRLLAILTRKFLERSQDNDKDNVISLEVPIPAMDNGGSGKFVCCGYQHHHSQRKPLAKSLSEKCPTLNVQSPRNSLSQWPTRAIARANRRK